MKRYGAAFSTSRTKLFLLDFGKYLVLLLLFLGTLAGWNNISATRTYICVLSGHSPLAHFLIDLKRESDKP